jgi:pimeloyl-ACP methyl ester carboxylesterase
MFPLLLTAALTAIAFSAVPVRQKLKRDGYTQCQPSGSRVNVGQRRMYTRMMGKREPGQALVVLEAGYGDWSKCWAAVQPEIAKYARVLSYDRAGSGWSDPSPLTRTPERIARELHELLETLGEPGPYLLVGHSMGGPLCRMFYNLYPDEVCGMVWVDSAHERMDLFLPFFAVARKSLIASLQIGRLLSHTGLSRIFARPRLLSAAFRMVSKPDAVRELRAQVTSPHYFDWLYSETRQFLISQNWPNARLPLGLPVISLEALYTSGPPRSIPSRHWDEFLSGWRAIQKDIGGYSSHLVRVGVPAGHAIMFERPNIVVQAVQEMLQLSYEHCTVTLPGQTPAASSHRGQAQPANLARPGIKPGGSGAAG